MKLPAVVLLITWAAAASAAESRPNGIPGPLPRFAIKPLAQDYYPMNSRNLGEQGTVNIRLCYDGWGKVTASTLEQSSGFERLDQSALRMGWAYRIKPRVLKGQPQPDCVVIAVKFSLQQSQDPPDRGEGMDGIRPPASHPPPKLVPLIGEASGRNSAASVDM